MLPKGRGAILFTGATPVPVGVPKTGFPAETMAHVAATNIASQIRGEEPTKEESFGDIPAVCTATGSPRASTTRPARTQPRTSLSTRSFGGGPLPSAKGALGSWMR